MQSKPILLISPLPPPQGGIAVWTKKLISAGLPDGSPFTLVNTKIRGRRNIFDSVGFSFAEMFRTSHILISLLRHLILRRPKLIHLNCSLSPIGVIRDFICLQLARLFRVPLIMHYHGNLQDYPEKRFYGLSKKILHHLLHRASANIVINAPSLEKAKNILPKNKAPVLLPNFIDDNVFTHEKNVRAEKDRYKAIFGGGITTAKGCAEILSAAKELPDIDFHLFGKMHDDLHALFRNPLANIFLHGEVPHAHLLKEMTQSDFLLFPSHSEGFPLTVLEAMSLSLPIVASRVGAIPEMVVDGKGGYLFTPRDVTTLIQAVKNLIANPQQMSAMGKFNRNKSYNHYRFSAVVRQLSSIYNSVLET